MPLSLKAGVCSSPASWHGLVIQVAWFVDAVLVAALVLPDDNIVHVDGQHVAQDLHLLIPDVFRR